MRSYSFLIAAGCLAILHLLLYPVTFSQKKEITQQLDNKYVLPASFTKIASLDFKGLAADFQFLQAVFFLGDKMERQEAVTLEDWHYFKRIITEVVELDPYFYDPYYFGPPMLAWEPHMHKEALDILEKGLTHRKNDYHIPFTMAFIHFYFLGNNEQGAKYLQIAAKKKNAPKLFFTKLASRLAYYSGNKTLAISLLDNMLATERRENIRKLYIKRKEALERAIFLENAMEEYQKRHGKLPKDLKQLVDANIIKNIPSDPYGGTWVILKNKRVFSTSKFAKIVKRSPSPENQD